MTHPWFCETINITHGLNNTILGFGAKPPPKHMALKVDLVYKEGLTKGGFT